MKFNEKNAIFMDFFNNLTPHPLFFTLIYIKMTAVTTFDYTALAAQSGFLKIACIKPPSLDDGQLASQLDNWLRTNAGTLSYIDSRHDILVRPFEQRPWANSLIVASFLPEERHSPLQSLPLAHDNRPFVEIAPYALNRDYHETGMEKLQALSEILQKQLGTARMELGVDSEPVLEKPLAQIAGLGSHAMNSLIYDNQHACGIHLAILFTSLDLPEHLLHTSPDCPRCGNCLAACPTKAFNLQDGFHVRRCRAWLSGEHRGPLTWDEQVLLGPTLFGCGKCTSACPKTDYAHPLAIDAEDFLRLPSAAVTRIIKGTALEHTGTTVLKRNAVAAIGQQLPLEMRNARRHELLELCASPAIRQTIEAWPK